MATSRVVANFIPSVNGFRFTNSFPDEPDVRLDLGPVGKVSLGDASQGVCGGMAFAVRDYFEAQLPIPEIGTPPASGTPLFSHLVKRLLDSFDVPTGVMKYAEWMMLPTNDLNLVISRQRGTFSRTVNQSWPQVRADVDADHPSPLGLVTVHTMDLSQIRRCHQVLVYGYQVDDDQTVTLNLYDPNTPPDSADDVWITFGAADPHKPSPISCNINIAESTLHGFFRSQYAAKTPPDAQ
jgi:hypothetical protein